ncbi:hypothetical protein MNBD_ALPHA04-466 [hydrothermal vent metagenome]|uniref:Thioredoxin domain-containing protein n=1 Tax=hydrothermal vent metagenome TaxID=652676 RepID=A0A3B0RAZ2_9ZZZZ
MRVATTLSLIPAIMLVSCADADQQSANENGKTEATSSAKPMKSVVVKPISEEDSIDAGLAVGKIAPLSVLFQTADGEQSLKSLLTDGPAVLIFTRSVSWCPFCQTQLKSINTIQSELKTRGYQLYGISYDSPEEQERFSKNQMLDYMMLSDQKSAAIDAFGLRDPQYTEGRAVGVPYASVIIVDKHGKILSKSVSGDYKKRPTNDQILALVDAI